MSLFYLTKRLLSSFSTFKFLSLFTFVLVFFLLSQNVYSFDVTLAWDPNSEKDLAGYRIFYREEGQNYNYEEPDWEGSETTCTIYNLDDNTTYCFVARAFDIWGSESGDSNETCYASQEIDINTDTDGDEDGLTNNDEINIYGTNPNNPDTDGDGINDGDEVEFWGYNWDMDFDNDSIINLLDTDSDNDGFMDGTEKDQGFDPGDPNSKPEFPLESGEVIVDHNWKWVEFNDSFIDPVVVARSLSCNEDDPAVVRIGYVDATGFVIRVQEWDYLDGIHADETVVYMVMERGTYTLPDGTMVKAGTFDTDRTGSFGWVNFSQTFNQVPVVTTTVLSFNEKDAVCCRLRNINTAGFDFCMQEQELNGQIHATETISYIAWEPSSGTIGNLTFEVEKTDDVITHDWQNIVYNETFMNVPVFLADMQTSNGGNTANLRWQNKDFYGIDVKIAEEQSLDSEIYHTTEVVGYMVFSNRL